MGGDFKSLIVGWAATVLGAVMLIDWLDARLYLERHRTTWVLVQLRYFAFGTLLFTAGKVLVDGFRKGWDYVALSRGANESVVAPNVTRLQYPNCADNADVALYTIKGEGHQWPGGKRVAAEWMLGPYRNSINATRQMWAFFSEHPFIRK